MFTVYPDPGVTRCFNCQAFGHVATRYEGTIVCSLRGEEGRGWQSPDCQQEQIGRSTHQGNLCEL